MNAEPNNLPREGRLPLSLLVDSMAGDARRDEDFARRFSRWLSNRLNGAFSAGIAASGAPQEVAWLLNYLFETVLDGRNASVCDGVQRALGREPIDFADFARGIAVSGIWNQASSNEEKLAS